MIFVTLSVFTPSFEMVKVCWKIILSMSLGALFPPKQKFPRLYTIFFLYILQFPEVHEDDVRTPGQRQGQWQDVQVWSDWSLERFLFISPVEDNDDQLCAIFFYLGNVVFQLLFTL